MKLLKRLLLVLAILLVGAVVTASVGYYMLKRRPSFYHSYKWTGEQRSVVNQRAVDKLTQTRNFAAEAAAKERQAVLKGTTLPGDARPMTVTFSEEELNAFLLHNFKDRLDDYVDDPGIFLSEGAIILAGQIKDSGYVVSFHFEPKIDEQGKLHLRLVRSYGGALPVPQSMVNAQFEKVRAALKRRIPGWQESATLDARGANNSAVAASMGKLILNALDDKPADPILFMPDDSGKSLPLRLVDIAVGKELTLTVQPLTPEQRAELIKSIRSPLVAMVEEQH
ncbi:MAG TPA: hypothetical protein VGP99_10820 [Tepidisphaeraceae bacterium]|jgi:hypothetical protein|nr:hypothetical protein [Tepidisphaeraceae bacterium]